MSRNVKLQVCRGLRANMPTLGAGEFYFCTDTNELYVGNITNQRVGVSAALATGLSGNGNIQGPSSSVTGPRTPRTVVAFAQIDIAGTIYWIPLMQ